ncbi:MAG TPA: hypothetical protein PK605_05535 [Ignavibacteria bacterium]|nr:hypothetical protein [Ignavibacteria bacterium]HRF66207.1 hypothetical protein [Ignavibacteria bacterium]HRJ03847.1 hypothetical protein [Ignavibacteria bacterium]HRJ85084.1 hypothetical protein [Ignavibacteria bacterium]
MKNKHIFILPLVLLSLLTGIFSGWFRIGWNLPISLPSGEHGALMVGSFLGTLICIERSVSYHNKIALLVPMLNGMSLVFFLLAMPKIAYVLLILGGAGLTGIYYMVYVKHKGIHILIMMAGAMCYLIGSAILFNSTFYPAVVMWWIAFLFLTITGERLELSRFILLKNTLKKQAVLIILISLFIISIFLPFHSDLGSLLSAVSMIGSAVWLLKFDMAKHSLKKPGQSFYSGVLLITGYVWLVITGLFFTFGAYFGSFYDASLHAFFLGFVFMMIFAHAPVILPAVLKLGISPFGKTLYIWYILLNLTLIFRVLTFIPGVAAYKHWAGMLNGIAILGFFANMIVLAKLARRKLKAATANIPQVNRQAQSMQC